LRAAPQDAPAAAPESLAKMHSGQGCSPFAVAGAAAGAGRLKLVDAEEEE